MIITMDNVPDTIPLPPVGKPFSFTVAVAEEKESQNGKQMLAVELVMTEPGEDWSPFRAFEYFVEPLRNMRAKVALKRFLRAVGVNPEGSIDSESLKGLTGTAVLKEDRRVDKETKEVTIGRRVKDYVVG